MRISHRTNHVGEDIFTPHEKPSNRFLDISLYGTTNPHPAYEMYLNPHCYHVFEYVVSGKGHIEYGSEHITVSAGDFYFLRRGFIGHYYADPEEPYQKIWINASGSMIDDLVNTFNITSPALVHRKGAPMEEVIRRVHRRLDECEDKDYLELMQQISVDIFELLSLAKAADVISSSVYTNHPMENIKLYIRSCIFTDLDLASLSEHFHINPSYLIRKFKKAVGMTPMHYFNKCRIEAARSMLMLPRRPVKTVALALKYSDTAYFSSCFKAETGYAPSEYTPEVHAAYIAGK